MLTDCCSQNSQVRTMRKPTLLVAVLPLLLQSTALVAALQGQTRHVTLTKSRRGKHEPGRSSLGEGHDRHELATALQLARGGAVAARGISDRFRKKKPPPAVAVVVTSKPINTNDLAPAPPAGTATISNETFNIIKSIVGAGVLGLPAGIAAFGNSRTAVYPALVLLIGIGFLAAQGFSMIGTICARTNAISYRQAWSRTVGEGTAWMPATACLMVTACSVLTYSMILADTVPSVVRVLFGVTVSRTTALLGMTGTVLLPLCLMKQLSSLAPFSLLGILGMAFTASAMVVRYVTGAYAVPNGQLLAELTDALQPSFGAAGWQSVFSPNSAILVSMLSTAFMAHYNAPKFYWELKDTSIPRFNRVVALSFAGAVLLMAVTAVAGFATFGAGCSSLILNNYAAKDSLMSLSRAAVTVSLMFSYPLAFVGVREGLLDLLKVPMQKRDRLSDPLSVGLLAIITGLAFMLKDIGVILALGGATWGNCVIYLFPAVMLVKAAQKDGSDSELKKQVPRAIGTGLLGLCLGAVGTVRALQNL